MIPFKLRKKILTKLTGLPTVLAQTAAEPADASQATKPIAGSPPNFIASNVYTSLRKAFLPNAMTIVDNLSSYLNNALFYASNGEFSMAKMHGINFNFTETVVSSQNKDLKNLAMFAKEVYTVIYNSGAVYSDKLNKKQFTDKINLLLRSQNLNNLSQTNPTGQLAIKMGGNVKTDIIDLLKTLLSVAPTE